MLTSGINFLNFKKKVKSKKIKKYLIDLINKNSPIIQSLSKNYKDKFNKSFLSKIKKKKIIDYWVWADLLLVRKLFINFLEM